MIDKLKNLKITSISDIKKVRSINELDQLKSDILGKKSQLNAILKELPTLSPEQRPIVGKNANLIKIELEEAIKQQHAKIIKSIRNAQISNYNKDHTIPTTGIDSGHYHPITIVTRKICSILTKCGFSIKQGPNIENDFYNFEALNIPDNHPAKDMHDTFYLKNNYVLRTHTSPVQIRTMLQQTPPIKMIAPGKVYRCDADASHSPVFHQIEGLYVDKQVTFADLKGTLEYFLRELFGHDKNIRFRSSYFPFTEPSVEVDVEYTINGKTRWLEIMGAGMVQHNVFRHVDIDPTQFSGYAFGCGVERIAMILYEIDNIRLFYENDQRFLKQF